ncbi:MULTISPECIES: NAD(P)H-binding protein [Nocardiopsis]|uniref:NAD(P)-binding domain-containing protein n=1 Tax=Nocardiopsis sinuspersici TaxID=501010 RepID=A0A1V3C8E8_9ACTN|nr:MULTISPECIES: NAD(P)H-binding protein [Nocardiopsis]OOC57045.1 hypothetical protein NOSIN_06710 [Nocardiopsis sinuspersici]
MKTRGKILVTGATGNIGRHVVSGLRTAGADVRALVRTPSAARLPEGVEVVGGDLSAPEKLDHALEGVDTLFLLWPLVTADGAPALIQAASRHARRIVYVSAAVSDEAGSEDNGVWGRIEREIAASGLEWTFLRVGGLAANTLGWADQIRLDGTVRWTYGAAGRSLVHERDVADVAVLALTEDGHVGAKYVLTGPEVLTQAEQVRLIGEALGRPVRWEEVPREVTRDGFLAQIGDPAFAEAALDAWGGMVENPEPVSTAVEEVTGHPARTFREWAADHAHDFRPLPTAEAAGHARSASR